MTKILYLTDYFIKVIDLQKNIDTKNYVIYESSWTELESFERFLKSSNKDFFSIVFDFADENIAYDWTPKLMPWEKPGYVKQIKDKFTGKKGLFINIEWLNRFRKNEHGASEQLMLTSSVFGNKEVNQFFSLIAEAELSIESIYSYSFLLEKYFLKKVSKKLGLTKKAINKPFLLNLQESKHKFKQVFFNDGRLRVTRTIELDKEITEDNILTIALSNESITTVRYLYNQKIIPFNTEVGFVNLGLGFSKNIDIIKTFQELSKVPVEQEGMPYKDISLYEVEKIAKEKVLEYGAIGFIANFIKSNKIPSFYTNKFVEKLAILKRLRLLLLAFICGIIFFGSIYVVNLMVEDLTLKEKISSMDRKLSQYNLEMERLQKTISFEDDAEDIKASVDFSESILKVKSKKLLENSFLDISTVVSEHEHISIAKLNWRKIKTFDSKNTEIILEGWVYPFNQSYEMPVKWVDELLKRLIENKNIKKVNILKEPLDRDLQRSLSIFEGNVETVNALPFTLKITLDYAE